MGRSLSRLARMLVLSGFLFAGCSNGPRFPGEEAPPEQLRERVLKELAGIDDSLSRESRDVRFTRFRRLALDPDDALRGVTEKYCIAINYSCRFPQTADVWLDTYLWLIAERDSSAWSIRRSTEPGGCCE